MKCESNTEKCSISESAANFQEDWYEVRDLFSHSELTGFGSSISELIQMQCKKINVQCTNSIYENILLLNQVSSNALNEALVMARNSHYGHLLASNNRLIDQSSGFLRCSKDLLIVSGPSFFVNLPSNNARKYTWHSEQNWYPKRRNFPNIWCPIFQDRTLDDSMAVKRESHKKDWFYFSEYTGYDGDFDSNSNIQYEIPDTFISAYPTDVPEVCVGQGLFFNGKLVHRSLNNNSSLPFITFVFRVFDYSKDLTLSANWTDIPYNRKSLGWPEINVNP
jgi:hypothetical protein